MQAEDSYRLALKECWQALDSSLSMLWFIFIFVLVSTEEEFTWNRWEKRTVNCLGANGSPLGCKLEAPNASPPRDPNKYKCRSESMPQNKWNTLARNSTRIACPLGCEPDFDLSVITKVPYDNAKCQKYYTYGKYRSVEENEWFLWLTEPCEAALTTHCRFKDVPLNAKSQRKHKKLVQ